VKAPVDLSLAEITALRKAVYALDKLAPHVVTEIGWEQLRSALQTLAATAPTLHCQGCQKSAPRLRKRLCDSCYFRQYRREKTDTLSKTL